MSTVQIAAEGTTTAYTVTRESGVVVLFPSTVRVRSGRGWATLPGGDDVREHARSDLDTSDYRYTHGGETFRAACDRAREIAGGAL
jgi:hypothetical protein